MIWNLVNVTSPTQVEGHVLVARFDQDERVWEFAYIASCDVGTSWSHWAIFDPPFNAP
jgi:hypothetical protein